MGGAICHCQDNSAQAVGCHCQDNSAQPEERVVRPNARKGLCQPPKDGKLHDEDEDGWWAVDPWSPDVIGGFARAQSSAYCCEATADADCSSDDMEGGAEEIDDLAAPTKVARAAVLLAPLTTTGNSKRHKANFPTSLACSVPQAHVSEGQQARRSVSAPSSSTTSPRNPILVTRQVSSAAMMSHTAMNEEGSRGAAPMDMSHWDAARAVMDAFRKTPGLMVTSPSQLRSESVSANSSKVDDPHRTAAEPQRRRYSPESSHRDATSSGLALKNNAQRDCMSLGASCRDTSQRRGRSPGTSQRDEVSLHTPPNPPRQLEKVVRRRSVAFGEVKVQEFEASPTRDNSPPPRGAPATSLLRDASPPPRAAPAAQAAGLVHGWSTFVLRVQMSGNKSGRLTFSKDDDLARASSTFLREHGLSSVCQSGLEATLREMVLKGNAFNTVDIADIV